MFSSSCCKEDLNFQAKVYYKLYILTDVLNNLFHY